MSIVVVGSVNLDLAASVSRLPVPGETITDATLGKFPGGKGANQALAARRLGAEVALVACVGDDVHADEALSLLKAGDVDLSHCQRITDAPTGVALIAVAPDGENHIVVAPGANRYLHANSFELPNAQALICQLEVPIDTVHRAVVEFSGFVCVNLAPARDVPNELLIETDLIVVNETEADFYGDALHRTTAVVVTTLGAGGAVAHQAGKTIGRGRAPRVPVVDTVGAGDTFTAALVVAMSEQRPINQALEFACTAGALATTREGAQTSLPTRAEVNAFAAGK